MGWPDREPAPASMFHGMMNAISRAGRSFRTAAQAMEEYKKAMAETGFKGCLECGAPLEPDGIEHSVGCSGLQLTPGLVVVPVAGATQVVDTGAKLPLARPRAANVNLLPPLPAATIPLRPAASYVLSERQAVKIPLEDLFPLPKNDPVVRIVTDLGRAGEVQQLGLSRDLMVYVDRLYPREREVLMAWLSLKDPLVQQPATKPEPAGPVARVGDRTVELEGER